MRNNLLFENPTQKPRLYIYDRVYSSQKYETPSLYNYIQMIMMYLSTTIEERLCDHHLNDDELLTRYNHAVHVFQSAHTDDLVPNATIMPGSHTQKHYIHFMVAEIQGEMRYDTSYGRTVLTMEHHSFNEKNVLIDFLFHVLRTIPDIECLKQYEINWVELWPEICEQWQASFVLGTMVNIPDMLCIPELKRSLLTQIEEINIMVSL